MPAREPWDGLAADLSSHAGALRRIASALCGASDADDALQHAAVIALEDRAAQSGARPVGWLAGLVRNVARNARRGELRRRTREQAGAHAEPVASAAARAERLDVEARLASFVRELPAAQCEVLYLRFWEGLPPREIAARLGVDVEAVKSRQKRALVALRERLDAESEGGRETWLSALGTLGAGEMSAAAGAATNATTPLAVGAFLLGAKQVVVAVLVAAVAAFAWWRVSGSAGPNPPPPIDLAAPAAPAPTDAVASAPDGESTSAGRAAPSERVVAASDSEVARPAADALTLGPDLSNALLGMVVDLKGDPIGDVRIELLEGNETFGVATSDEHGHFAISRPSVNGFGFLRATRAGYVAVVSPFTQWSAQARWLPVRIRMARPATLLVAFEDGHGAPIEGPTVRIAISTAEIDGRNERVKDGPRVKVGADGIARFENACAELRLALHVELGGAKWRIEHARDGEAVLGEPTSGASPIILEPGAIQRLVVRLASAHTLRGVVLDEDGIPRAKAGVRLVSIGVPRGDPARVEESARTDENGRFAFELRLLPGAEGLLVLAADRASYLFAAERLASAIVATSELRDTSANELRLVLTPCAPISGRVLDENGVGIAAGIQAFPADDLAIACMSATEHPGRADARTDGSFAVRGLPVGDYEIVAHAAFHAPVRAEPVPAGASDVAIRLSSPVRVRVTYVVEAPAGVELDSIEILHGQLDVSPASPINVPLLGATSTWDLPNGWPARQSTQPALLRQASDATQTQYGPVTLVAQPMRGTEETRDIELGWHWLGARATTKGGYACFPISTGLVRVEDGEHRVVFRLTPGAAITGRAAGLGAPGEVCVALYRDGADRVNLPISGRDASMRSFVELGADGSFDLSLVPSGPVELRAGTRAELESGRWRARAPLDLAPNERREVVLGR